MNYKLFLKIYKKQLTFISRSDKIKTQKFIGGIYNEQPEQKSKQQAEQQPKQQSESEQQAGQVLQVKKPPKEAFLRRSIYNTSTMRSSEKKYKYLAFTGLSSSV
mgnify:CR=1 FL=1